MTDLRTKVLTVVPPLVVAAVSIVLLLSLDLPARIAVHWGVNGVDRLAGVGDLIAPIAVFVPLSTAVAFALLVFGSSAPRMAWFGRFVVATSMLVGGSVCLILLSTAVAQVGVVDVSSVGVGTSLAYAGLGFLVAVVLAVGCAALTPLGPVNVRSTAPAPSLALSDTERASWSHSVGPSTVAIAVLAAALVIVVLVLAFAGAPVVLTLVIVLLFVAVGGSLFWRVTIDARGVIVRSALGVPRFRIDPASVVEARSIDVSPLRQFGGWGIRIGGAGWGVVVRAGSALEVARVGKSRFIVTVDDAATGAALLTAVARATRTDA